MTKIPNPNLDRLKAVSETMAEAVENKSGYDAIVLSNAEWKLIAADLLRLAEENEALKELVGSQAGNLVSLTDAFHDAIRRPMGVVPKSGEQFYDQDRE